ncbi:MAG: hypothetical protein CL471_18035 [Acidobacteria bacterium]|jgi:hypothetical protein|nr:hypothetical protein [Acidobacteriota bacterium]|tara:strand:+ start:219 stop:1139 length:921 start_codon:yes stop_codon:yes gene_type:complete
MPDAEDVLMPDAEDVLEITCLSPDNEAEQHCWLQSGESVYLGREPQPADASITLSGATSRVSRTAAKITFEDGTVIVKKISSGSDGVVTEEFSCFIPRRSRVILGDGQQYIFREPGFFEIPDTEGTHQVRLDFDAPERPVAVGGPHPTLPNPHATVWNELCTQSEGRKRTCLALVAAWFIHDFKYIPAETIPTSKQLAHLCGKSESSVNNALYRTRRFLDPRQADVDRGDISPGHLDRGPLVGIQFRDETPPDNVNWGKEELAKWVMIVSRSASPPPITMEDILRLPGLTNPTPAAAAELIRHQLL